MKKVIVGKSKGIAEAEQCDIHVVVKSLKIRKETTIDDYINLFYDKRGSKYFSKGSCLLRDMAQIKRRYNRFIKRTI